MRRPAAVLLLLIGTLFTGALLAAEEKPLRLLFIGNSLTYTNDLPTMVRRIGKLDGRRITTTMIAGPNLSLEDHLASAATRRRIESGKWDAIVLQQGPSAAEESRKALIRDVARVRDIAPHDAAIAVMTVWPDRSRIVLFDRIIETHRLAAAAVEGILIPAGTAWRNALRAAPPPPLYSSDGFHPSETGSYLVALASYRALVGPLPEAAATKRGARAVIGARVVPSESELEVIVRAVEQR